MYLKLHLSTASAVSMFLDVTNLNIVKMRKVLLIMVAVFLLSQATFFVLKFFLTGAHYMISARLNIAVLQQFVMIFGSIFIWWNLSPAIDGFVHIFYIFQTFKALMHLVIFKSYISILTAFFNHRVFQCFGWSTAATLV